MQGKTVPDTGGSQVERTSSAKSTGNFQKGEGGYGGGPWVKGMDTTGNEAQETERTRGN